MKRQLITLGSTGLSETQSRYSTVDLETLALVYAVNKLENYLRYCSSIRVFMDSKNLADYMQMALPDIKNNQIQRMLERLRPYAIEVTHVRGRDQLPRRPLEQEPLRGQGS